LTGLVYRPDPRKERQAARPLLEVAPRRGPARRRNFDRVIPPPAGAGYDDPGWVQHRRVPVAWPCWRPAGSGPSKAASS